MSDLAIIGGSGLTKLNGLIVIKQQEYETPYGMPSGILTYGTYANKEIIFLPRHGDPHVIPPHKINYRANIWALKECQVKNIIGVNAVGGVTEEMYPGRLICPDQIIDYTWSRAHTFFDGDQNTVTHIDFSQPYSKNLRSLLINTTTTDKLDLYPAGTYGATQGPRLETAAEIERMERDGCDIIGMTGMPEAALARELEIDYASISIIANWAAGKSEEKITMEMIDRNLNAAMSKVHALLAAVIPKI